jgi:hypothetical protein
MKGRLFQAVFFFSQKISSFLGLLYLPPDVDTSTQSNGVLFILIQVLPVVHVDG